MTDDILAVLRDVWERVEGGVRDRRSAFHTQTLATLSLDGRPRARTVVLRAVDRDARQLRFHCDARSDKFAEIAAAPRLAVHVYDAEAKIQVRAEGVGTLHRTDAFTDAAWNESRPGSLVAYGTEPAPGSAIEEGGAYSVPGEGAAAAGQGNFAAVSVSVETIEYVFLAHSGHRRARFAFEAGRLEATWLVP